MMSNTLRVLYVGVTNDIVRRVFQHQKKTIGWFYKEIQSSPVGMFEETPNVRAAIEREKQVKGWSRKKKTALIDAMNPEWKDLSHGWFDR